MTFEEFQKAMMAFALFPSDITKDAEHVAQLLSDEERQHLLDMLNNIHASCAKLEKQRIEQFAQATKELGSLRRKYVPAMHAEIEQVDKEKALEEISQKLDD